MADVLEKNNNNKNNNVMFAKFISHVMYHTHIRCNYYRHEFNNNLTFHFDMMNLYKDQMLR